jgi:hypothetical protein
MDQMSDAIQGVFDQPDWLYFDPEGRGDYWQTDWFGLGPGETKEFQLRATVVRGPDPIVNNAWLLNEGGGGYEGEVSVTVQVVE